MNLVKVVLTRRATGKRERVRGCIRAAREVRDGDVRRERRAGDRRRRRVANGPRRSEVDVHGARAIGNGREHLAEVEGVQSEREVIRRRCRATAHGELILVRRGQGNRRERHGGGRPTHRGQVQRERVTRCGVRVVHDRRRRASTRRCLVKHPSRLTVAPVVEGAPPEQERRDAPGLNVRHVRRWRRVRLSPGRPLHEGQHATISGRHDARHDRSGVRHGRQDSPRRIARCARAHRESHEASVDLSVPAARVHAVEHVERRVRFRLDPRARDAHTRGRDRRTVVIRIDGACVRTRIARRERNDSVPEVQDAPVGSPDVGAPEPSHAFATDPAHRRRHQRRKLVESPLDVWPHEVPGVRVEDRDRARRVRSRGILDVRVKSARRRAHLARSDGRGAHGTRRCETSPRENAQGIVRARHGSSSCGEEKILGSEHGDDGRRRPHGRVSHDHLVVGIQHSPPREHQKDELAGSE